MRFLHRQLALRTKSRAEFKSVDYLKKRSVDCFCPATYKSRQWSDRTKRVKAALFSQYIFAKLSCVELLSICACQNIVGFVRSGGEPDTIQENQIKGLRELCNNHENYVLGPGNLRKEQNIRVIAGPFIGQEAEVCFTGTSKEVFIRIGTSGLSVQIPFSHVEPLNENSHVN
ncbi:MAG: UpxY family transcription antiterminator [Bacteroidota bacterium]|nr:UpxY family transcription antiterminator [Bacteroidota bacterium]